MDFDEYKDLKLRNMTDSARKRLFRSLAFTNKATSVNNPKIKEQIEKLQKRDYDDDDQFGYGIVPPIYPTKMLVNLVKLLARIYEGYTSEQVINGTKRLLNTLYNNKIITETVYNHLANI